MLLSDHYRLIEIGCLIVLSKGYASSNLCLYQQYFYIRSGGVAITYHLLVFNVQKKSYISRCCSFMYFYNSIRSIRHTEYECNLFCALFKYCCYSEQYSMSILAHLSKERQGLSKLLQGSLLIAVFFMIQHCSCACMSSIHGGLFGVSRGLAELF